MATFPVNLPLTPLFLQGESVPLVRTLAVKYLKIPKLGKELVSSENIILVDTRKYITHHATSFSWLLGYSKINVIPNHSSLWGWEYFFLASLPGPFPHRLRHIHTHKHILHVLMLHSFVDYSIMLMLNHLKSFRKQVTYKLQRSRVW